MANKISLSLHTLPVELIYRIFDHLDGTVILLSVRNVCIRLNAIIDTYKPYQVMFCLVPVMKNKFAE
jgi:hypothetical protein